MPRRWPRVTGAGTVSALVITLKNGNQSFRTMSKPIYICLCLLIMNTKLNAQAHEAANYRELIKTSIIRDYPGMLHEPTGALAYPFVTPGSVYAKELWDWDSWLSDVALCQIMTD